MNIDFLSADGHKWLLGPEGAGIFYIRRDLIESTRPLSIGSMNVINHMDYGHYDYTLKSTAGRYECGTYNVPGLHGLNAAVKLLIEVSVEKISERLLILTSHFIRGLEQKGYNIIQRPHRRPMERQRGLRLTHPRSSTNRYHPPQTAFTPRSPCENPASAALPISITPSNNWRGYSNCSPAIDLLGWYLRVQGKRLAPIRDTELCRRAAAATPVTRAGQNPILAC